MKTHMSRSVLFLFLAAVSLCACGAAQEDDFSRGILDRPTVFQVAAGVTREKYPDADEVLVAGVQRIRYEEDATYVQWHEEYVKLLTEAGRRAHRTISTHFTIPYQRGPEDCSVPLVEIMKPDGTIVAVDVEKQSRVMIDPGSMSANIYNPNSKIIQVNVPGLEVGDVLHFVMFDRIVHPRMRGTWSDWYVFENKRPIVQSIVEVTGPAGKPLRSTVHKDAVEGTVTHSRQDHDGLVTYRWEARDVPRMFPEPDMPPVHTVVQRVLVSTAPDWQTVSRWYWRLSEPHFETDDAIRARVRELTDGIQDERKQLEAVFTFVSQQIRYMGITVEGTSPGYEPHDVQDTFKRRHGVCRDKAALLVAMLREAGFEAFPSLIHVGVKKDREVPQPYFNHAIVAVREKNGEYTLMDPTAETTTRLLPAHLNDRSYLVATPEGEALKTSPIDPAAHNLMRITTRGTVDPAGTFQADTVLQFEGVNDNAYRAWFARLKPEDRRRYFEGLVKKAAPGARIVAFRMLPEDMTDTSRVLTVSIGYTADDVLIQGAKTVMLPMPMLGLSVGMVNHILGRTGLRERKYPMITELACGVRETVALDLAGPWDVSPVLPRTEPMRGEALTWEQSLVFTNGSLAGTGDFRLEVTEFSPEQYQDLKKVLGHVERDVRKMPIFAKDRGQDGDVVILNDSVVYSLNDAHNWTCTQQVQKRVLTYAGKKRNSELKIDYNPAWEDVTLAEAVVTSADGEEHAIRPEEVNIMDAVWVGAAARYPAGKTLVASLPAVEIGSTISYRVVRRYRDRPFFAAYETFAAFDPVLRKRVRVDCPADLSLAVVPCGGWDMREAVVRIEEGRRIAEWSAESVAAVKLEARLPPPWSFLPTVAASAGRWDTYAREAGEALARAARSRAEVAGFTGSLSRGGRDPQAELRAIRDAVAFRVRPVGPQIHELPLSSITPADTTFREGYGNEADRAVLLYAMLDEAGFAPEFVLVSTVPAVDALVETLRKAPATWQLPTVLVRVRERLGLGRGEYIYLNDTDQYAWLGATPSDGRMGLVLPGGEWEEIRATRRDRSETEYEMAIAANGDARITKRVLVHGMDYSRENKRFSEMPPEERRRHHLELVAEVSQAAEARGELTTSFGSYPGVIEFTVDAPRFATRQGEYLYFSLLETLREFLGLRADTREHPLYFAGPVSRKVRFTINIDGQYTFEHAPPDLDLALLGGGPIGAWARTGTVTRPDATRLEIGWDATLAPALISADRYPELQQAQRALAHRGRQTVLLKQVLKEHP